jgi:hypothetical protein
MVPVNVIIDIVCMAVRGTYLGSDGFSVFLIVISSLLLPVKV